MYKHAKYYKPSIGMGEVDHSIKHLRLYIDNKHKYTKKQIDNAFSQITKGQAKRFRRYGKSRLPPPITCLLSIGKTKVK